MQLARLVETSERVAATSKRLEKIALLADLLRESRGEESEIATAFLTGATRQGRIGIGYAAMQKAHTEPSAESSLTLHEVDRAFQEIAEVSGRDATGRRTERLRKLMADATGAEQHFLLRLLSGELRQGALEGVLLEALAKASGVPAEDVRRAAMLAGDVAAIARPLLEEGTGALSRFSLQLFRPVQPMLAQTAEDVEEALGQLGSASLEYKMDGARVQVHRAGDEVRVYTRQLHDVTSASPEVVEAALALPARDFILDGEVIALKEDGRPHPFQITARRFGRKLDLQRMRQDLPLTPFFFDVLHLDGGDLLNAPQSERFAALGEIAPTYLIPHLRTEDPAEADRFATTALAQGHEGVMAKAPDAPYVAGARGASWLKVKQAHTLDLVILAAEWGHGRRRGFLSNLHLGARDTRTGAFAMLGKTFKGLTDEMLRWQTEELQKIEVARDSYTVYVEPKLVAEIAFNDVQVSPRYPSGMALRFARVKRYRPDKTVAEADTFEAVQRIADLA
jgi:DNA ligase 1